MHYPIHNVASRLYSRIMFGVCIAFTSCILALLALVTGYLVIKGFASINLSFFTKAPIPEGMEGFPGGMANNLLGSVILIALASLVGIPIGMLTGVYLSEYSANSFIASPTRFICDVLTGVPSIVVGILGYELVVRPIGDYNGYAGAAALAFIMIPIVARTTEEMLRLVPNSYREASVALGATKAYTIFKVIIPAATGSIITGIMLAIARVAGETAPLLFTTFGSLYFTVNPRHHFPSLTQQIYEFAKSGNTTQQKLAWAGMLVLLALIFVLNVGVRFFARSIQSRTA